MKLVILTSRFPYPLEKGDKLRIYNFIKELSRNHEITLIALSRREVSAPDYDKVKVYCRKIILFKLSKPDLLLNLFRSIFNGLPLQVGIFYKKSILGEILNFIMEDKPNALFCHLIRMSEYVKDINAFPKTLDYMDAFSKGMERRSGTSGFFFIRKFLKTEYKRLQKYENEIFDKFENKVIISEQDRDLITHSENKKINVIANGVDTDIFYPIKTEKKYDLLFTGNMGYPPNVESALYTIKYIYPAVKKNYPDINLLIAGIDPPGELKSLGTDHIKVIPEFSHIREAFAQSRIMLAPMLISIGLQNKILQAMAMKIPVVCSPLANNAIKAPVNSCILEAESIEEYSEKIELLLNDAGYYMEITENAYDFVLNNYNWKFISDKLEKIIFSGYNNLHLD